MILKNNLQQPTMVTVFVIWAIFWHFTAPPPLQVIRKIKYQNFKKMNKLSGHVIILHMCTKNHNHMMYASWENGLVGYGIAIRIGRFLVQTSLGAQPSFGTQPRYEAPGDLRVKSVEYALINIGFVILSPRKWPKVNHGTVK